ncbi:MAG TPA: acetyl-CoA carboxylase biotin carboxyl carrier protein subunit [Holophaga sp.]|nr:acetyl-CoA carboxylase biotin carboxyl carrier protein subunit [Holophaga sp.]
MKKMRITLNNQVFDVQVELLEDDEDRYPGAPTPAWSPAAAPAPKAPAAAPVSRAAAPAAPKAEAGTLSAPIVGSVSQILVEVGATVEENQPVVVLDAMKMDTYINAPRKGTVSAIHCRIGESVQVGQKLVSFS